MKENIFISHAYSNSPLTNTHQVNAICRTLVKETDNFLPVSPVHAFSYFDEEDADYREDILDWCEREIKKDETKKVFVFNFTEGCIKEANWALEAEDTELYIATLLVQKDPPAEEEIDELYNEAFSITYKKYEEEEATAPMIEEYKDHLRSSALEGAIEDGNQSEIQAK